MDVIDFSLTGGGTAADLIRRMAYHAFRRDHEPLGSEGYRRWQKRAVRCRRLLARLARAGG